MQEKVFVYEEGVSPEELAGTFISIDSKNWRRPRAVTLDGLSEVLNIKVGEDKNVTAVEYVHQDDNPEIPPNTIKVDTKTHIAVDDNYLYVWVPSLNRWKRMLLSTW
jgi:uncharacterized protein YuzE